MLFGRKHDTSRTIDNRIKTIPHKAYLIFGLTLVNLITPLFEGYYLTYFNKNAENNSLNFFQPYLKLIHVRTQIFFNLIISAEQ